MEVRLTLEELLPRVASIEPAGQPERLRSNFIGGTKHLPVRGEARLSRGAAPVRHGDPPPGTRRKNSLWPTLPDEPTRERVDTDPPTLRETQGAQVANRLRCYLA